jgi:hypothetical protein
MRIKKDSCGKRVLEAAVGWYAGVRIPGHLSIGRGQKPYQQQKAE